MESRIIIPTVQALTRIHAERYNYDASQALNYSTFPVSR
jgi:hypothetical protein